jgi:PST family polysaccharide transporter
MHRYERSKAAGLGKTVKQGVIWAVTGRGVITLITFVAGIVMARLLEPEDFGMYGIALIFTGLATRFGNVGFGLALIQRKEIREEHVSSLFVVHLLTFFALTGLLNLVAPLIGSAFGNPLTGRVVGVTALMFLTTPFSSVAKVIVQRRMEFRGPTVAGVLDHLVAAIAAIIFAVLGYGVWSLVYGNLLGTLSSTIYIVVNSRWKPRFIYNHSAMKDLYFYGLNIFLKNLLIYASDKIDYFIVGKTLGNAPLGLYEKSFHVMEMAVRQLYDRIGMILFSAFSTMQEDRTKIREAYSKVILTFSLLSFPVFFGLFTIAPAFIHVLYGEKWSPSIVPFQILCVAGIFRMQLQVVSTIINAMGKVSVELWQRAMAFVLLAVGCWIGSVWDITGVSVAVVVTTALLTATLVAYLNRLTGLTWLDTLRPQCPAFVAALVMSGVTFLYQRWIEGGLGPYSLAMLLSSTTVGTVVYVLALWIFKPAPIVSLVKEFVADLKPLARGVVR